MECFLNGWVSEFKSVWFWDWENRGRLSLQCLNHTPMIVLRNLWWWWWSMTLLQCLQQQHGVGGTNKIGPTCWKQSQHYKAMSKPPSQIPAKKRKAFDHKQCWYPKRAGREWWRHWEWCKCWARIPCGTVETRDRNASPTSSKRHWMMQYVRLYVHCVHIRQLEHEHEQGRNQWNPKQTHVISHCSPLLAQINRGDAIAWKGCRGITCNGLFFFVKSKKNTKMLFSKWHVDWWYLPRTVSIIPFWENLGSADWHQQNPCLSFTQKPEDINCNDYISGSVFT